MIMTYTEHTFLSPTYKGATAGEPSRTQVSWELFGNWRSLCLIKAIRLSGDRGCSFAHDVIQDTIYQHFPLHTASTSIYIHGKTCGCKEGHVKTISAFWKPTSSRGSNNKYSWTPKWGSVQLDCRNTKDFSTADAVPFEILVDGGVPSTWHSNGY